MCGGVRGKFFYFCPATGDSEPKSVFFIIQTD